MKSLSRISKTSLHECPAQPAKFSQQEYYLEFNSGIFIDFIMKITWHAKCHLRR